MARFANQTAVRKTFKTPDTHNHAGGQAFDQSDKMKLVSILLTSMVKDQFYRGASDTVAELTDLVGKVDPKFAAKAAIYARNEFGMRSITHIVGAEVPARVKGEEWTKDFVAKVIRRPDDATEILAYYLGKYGKPVPNSMKKGFSLGLAKFDSYQLAKYRGDKNAVSLVDVVNLAHVKPSAKNKDALEALINGTLKSAETWEAKISASGTAENKEEAKSEAWADLVNSGKIGQFALLRNLRNIETSAPQVLDKALELLVDPERIRKSLILPFRYATAVQEVTERKTVSVLSKALDVACSNCPKLNGDTVLAIDHSGSMGCTTGSPKDQADLFAAVMVKAFDADVVVFGTSAGYVKGINPDDSTLSIKAQISRAQHGHGTSFNAIYQTLNKKYDRVITLSDMQSWVGYYTPQAAASVYEKSYKAKPFHYNFDLAGYGTAQFPTDRIFELVGFSEKVFDIMKLLEQDKNALVNAIEAVEL